jgi:uncharacterized membrane protein YfcA
MLNDLFFYIVVLIANIFQGITGFAGTVLAMPASLFLVGYGVAKPILNVFGFFQASMYLPATADMLKKVS